MANMFDSDDRCSMCVPDPVFAAAAAAAAGNEVVSLIQEAAAMAAADAAVSSIVPEGVQSVVIRSWDRCIWHAV